jgi:AcrR family transcriptional regulator
MSCHTVSVPREDPPRLADRNRLRAMGDVRDAALELFARHGYDATTVDDIARAAGISRRTFFRYFPAKHDVLFLGHHERVGDLRHRLLELRGLPPVEAYMQALPTLRFADVPRRHARTLSLLIAQQPEVQRRLSELALDIEQALVDDLRDRGYPEQQAVLLAGALTGAIRAGQRMLSRQERAGNVLSDALAILGSHLDGPPH